MRRLWLVVAFLVSFRNSATAQEDLWRHAGNPTNAKGAKEFTPSPSERQSIANLLKKGQPQDACEEEGGSYGWLKQLRYTLLPLSAATRVLLVEAGPGCMRGGQGSNGAMWLIASDGSNLVLLASPQQGFQGFLYSVEPGSNKGYRDIIVGWHRGGRETGLSYLRFDGTVYRAARTPAFRRFGLSHEPVIPTSMPFATHLLPIRVIVDGALIDIYSPFLRDMPLPFQLIEGQRATKPHSPVAIFSTPANPVTTLFPRFSPYSTGPNAPNRQISPNPPAKLGPKGRLSMASDNQIHANRENAAHSTGPRTASGKDTSSRNNFRHGLAAKRLLIPGEDPEEYEALLAGYLDSYQPANSIEADLVAGMAESKWLSRRAIGLQNEALGRSWADRSVELALFMRYQVTHDRAFHKCLDQLIKLRAQKEKEQIGFESQKQREAQNQQKMSKVTPAEPPSDPAPGLFVAGEAPQPAPQLTVRASRQPEPMNRPI